MMDEGPVICSRLVGLARLLPTVADDTNVVTRADGGGVRGIYEVCLLARLKGRGIIHVDPIPLSKVSCPQVLAFRSNLCSS